MQSPHDIHESRQRFRDRLSLLRIYLAPVYFALLWTNWAVESGSFLSDSSSLHTGWELTKGSALPVLGVIVFVAVLQFLVRFPHSSHILWRLTIAFAGVAATLTQFLAAAVFLFTTMDPGEELIGLRLFSSLSDYQAGYYGVMALAWVYLLTAVVDAIARVVGKRISLAPDQQDVIFDSEAVGSLATDSDSAERRKRELVLLIHGTGSASDEDAGEGWWQVGGETWRKLSERLPKGIDCHGQGMVFHWSGHNSELARREGGRELHRFLLQLERNQTPYHIVAHSHGGSILWNAMQHAVGRGRRLQHLRSWTTLGTPFLRYKAYRNAWALAVPLALTLALAVANLGWFQAAANAWRLLVEGGYFPTILLLMAIVSAAAVLIAYNAFRVLRATWAWCACARQTHVDALVFQNYGGQWLPLWSRSDEAINGLQGTMQLVRSGDSQPPPETANPLLRFMRIGELPFRLAYQRIVRPIVDEFVWDRLMRTIQGNDLGDHRLAFTSPCPLPEKPVPPLNESIENELIEVANASCEKSGGLLRTSLGMAASCEYRLSQVGEHLASFLNGKELVHWTYYQVDSVLERIVAHISRHSAQSESAGVAAPSAGIAALETPPLEAATAKGAAAKNAAAKNAAAKSATGEGVNTSPVESNVARPYRPKKTAEHKSADHSGMRALVLAQMAVLACMALVGHTLHCYVLDQFTPQRQIKEIIWRTPAGPLENSRDVKALMEWSKQFAIAGLVPSDEKDLELFSGRVDDSAKLALVAALAKQDQSESAVRLSNRIRDPFFRTSSAIILGSIDINLLGQLELRDGQGEENSLPSYGENAERIAAAAELASEAQSQDELLRSALQVKHVRENVGGLQAFARMLGGRGLRGRELSEAAIAHAKAWSGDKEAIQLIQNGRKDGFGIVMGDSSYLEWMIALHPTEDWSEEANRVARTLLQSGSADDIGVVADIYSRHGGWRELLNFAALEDLPLDESARHSLQLETFLALRRHEILSLPDASLIGAPQHVQKAFQLHRSMDRRLQTLSRRAMQIGNVAAVIEPTDEERDHDHDPDRDSLAWLSHDEIKHLLGDLLISAGAQELADALAISLMNQATGPQSEHWTSSEEARDIGRLLAKCKQFYYARKMYPYMSERSHQLLVDSAILASYSDHLAATGSPLAPAYVALYREKDLELGLDRTTTYRFMQTW